MSRRILVTGAAGFVGGRLTERLIRDVAEGTNLVFTDLRLPIARDPRAQWIEGDFTRPEVRDLVLGNGVDVIYHLAGVLGGAAQRDPGLARRVNLEGALCLFEAAAAISAQAPKLVFASSIAVFGPPLPQFVIDSTPTFPTMVYGAQKRMIEIAIEQMSAVGSIDGVSLRLPGIVARRDIDTRLKSAFLSDLFLAFREQRDINLPVSPAGSTWLLSLDAVVDALLHAADLARELSPRERTITLPALRIQIGDLVQTLSHALPTSATRVSYHAASEIEEQFAAYPPLETALADRLGFRHDGSLAALVRNGLVALC